MKGSKENGKSQKHSQASDEGSVPSSQDSHPSSFLLCATCEFPWDDHLAGTHWMGCHFAKDRD